MDKNLENIERFELILKQQTNLRPSTLYKGLKNREANEGYPNQTLSAQTVLSTVSKQIKAMQNSEYVRCDKKILVNQNKYEKSSFLPLNMLQAQDSRVLQPPRPPDPQKFETQMFSNTQLINIVEDAEAMDVNNGMTQEFDTTFHHELDDDDGNDKRLQNEVFPIIDISLKERKPFIAVSPVEYEVDENVQINSKSENNFEEKALVETVDDMNENKNDNHLPLFNEHIEIEDEEVQQINEDDNSCINKYQGKVLTRREKEDKYDIPLSQTSSQKPPSPVFNIKTRKRKSISSSPLVFDLETYENFEKIAFPLVQRTPEKDEAKRLINFQILGKEFLFHGKGNNNETNKDRIITKVEEVKSSSPVIEIDDELLKIDKEFITKDIKRSKGYEENIKTDQSKESEKRILKDEILFSSDEEDGYNHDSYKDLPFTCALETSFYETCDVLDKTMYVGFQTASNKSIQIGTESFCKAKSLLDSVEKEFKEATLTELVKMCDINEVSKAANLKDTLNTSFSILDVEMEKNNESNNVAEIDKPVSNIISENENRTGLAKKIPTEKDSNSSGHPSDILRKALTTISSDKRFQGFKTASNKIIQLSGNALEKSKKLFHDIDLVENLEFLVETPEKAKTVEDNSPPNITDDKINEKISDNNENQLLTDERNIDDKIMQEFQDDLMDTELENIIQNMEFNEYHKVESSKENTQIFDNHIKFTGFKTASDRNIEISEAAIAKSKKVFQDIENANTPMHVIKETNTFNDDKDNLHKNRVEFKTANNKEIKISEKALAKTKYIFDNIDITDCVIDESSNQSQPTTRNKFKPFEDEETKTCNKEHEKSLFESKDKVFDIKEGDLEPPFYGFENSKRYVELVEETLLKSQNIIEKLGSEYFNSENASQIKNKYKVNTDMCEKDIDKEHSSLSNFEGFRTASNREVKISEKAMAKGKRMFEDINEDRTMDTNHEHVLFQTASSKQIKISEEALATSRKVFQNIDNDGLVELNKNYVDTKPDFKGFRTATNKAILVSEDALAKSRKIFQDFNVDEGSNGDCKYTVTKSKFEEFETAMNKEVMSTEAIAERDSLFEDYLRTKTANTRSDLKIEFKGFQTASNKEIKISESALVKSKKIFQEIVENKSTDSNFHPKTMGFQTSSNKEVKVPQQAFASKKSEESNKKLHGNDGRKNTELKFHGFQTASKKEVKISPEALAKSKKFFQDIENAATTEVNSKNYNPTAKTIDLCSKFKGFKTVSNKEVKISEKALDKSKKLFQDIAEENLLETCGNTDSGISPILSSAKFIGFQTANNREIKISAEAMAKSKKMFQDINIESSEAEKLENIIENANTNSKFKGFQTASNKEVKISEDALAKSRKLFQDLSTDVPVESNLNNTDEESRRIGAKGKALARSKQIFHDINDEKCTDYIPTSTFSGFQTANNKKVLISEEALARSKKMFQDYNDIDKPSNINVDIMKTEQQFKGFQTANNKKVVVSEEAITKSRKMFQDLEVISGCTTDISNTKICKTPSKLKDTETSNNDKKEISKGKSIIIPNNFETNTKQNQSNIVLKLEQKCNESLCDVDTQLLNNFEHSMLETTPIKSSKRSGSPILSCPKSKKRKVFQIPYSQKSPKKTIATDFIPPIVQKPENQYSFSPSYKKIKQYTLKDLQRFEETSTDSEEKLDISIPNFDFENLLQLEFVEKRNDISSSTIRIPELQTLFLNSVNEKLVPEGWLEIHLKLILWKLLSYEKKFPKIMSATCTAKNVLEQLKYRYDKELYNAERPALRKIFERDDTAAKSLVLCVVAILNPQEKSDSTTELLLTDGWYVIRTVTDKMLTKLVNTGKIKVGTKLVTHGAELVGSEQAVSPWEDTSSIRLRIFGNSTRRARWDARLGYHGNGAILSQLSSVALDGGKISKLRVYITRVYPTLYVDKFDDGSTVTRSERLEHLHQMKCENERQMQLEKIYEEVEKEVLDQSDLTSTQAALLEDHTSKEREKLIELFQSKVQSKMAAVGLNLNRNVVTLVKVRVASVEKRKDAVEINKALLSIWRPNDAVLELIKEGTWIEILNVVPTAIRYSELQISAGRQSIFIQSRYKEDDSIKPHIASLNRVCYYIKDLVKNPTMTTDYSEVDTVGVVIEIEPKLKEFDPNRHQFQNVYLTDANKNIISINFWGGLKKFGFENSLDTGHIVACTNLQKRAGNSRKNIPQYRVTEFTHFTKTPKNETARKIIEELHQQLCEIDKNVFILECIKLKNNYSAKLQINEKVTPYRFANVDINSSRNRIFIDSPAEQKIKKIDENLNLTGLDFDSTFKQSDSQEFSPKTLLRKQQVKERIAKLKRYGEPPPLSPMQIINKSKNASTAYKSPLISKSDVSNSVASVEKILPNRKEKSSNVSDAEIQCSPVICLNRTYVKRSNPVKLNFSKNEQTIDEFGEEFDCSPPLSLD